MDKGLVRRSPHLGLEIMWTLRLALFPNFQDFSTPNGVVEKISHSLKL